MHLTPHQAKYIAHDLPLQHAGGGLDRLSQALFNASVDLNPLMADLFRRIDMVEARGRGMPLILENAPDVEFREIARLFVASFERPSAVAVTTPETAAWLQKTTQERLVQLLREQPQLSAPAIAAALGIGKDGVKYHLNQLKQTGKLRRIGPNKGGRWEVTNPDSKGKT